MRGFLQIAGLGVVVLSSMIATELAPFAEIQASLPADAAKMVAAPFRGPAVAPGAAFDEWAEATLARPLFDQSRRPQQPAAANTPAAMELPRLTGIAVSPCCRNAIFVAIEAAKPLVLQEGKSVGGWRVDSITKDEVRLSGPEGMRVLHTTGGALPLPLVIRARGAAPTALAR